MDGSSSSIMYQLITTLSLSEHNRGPRELSGDAFKVMATNVKDV